MKPWTHTLATPVKTATPPLVSPCPRGVRRGAFEGKRSHLEFPLPEAGDYDLTVVEYRCRNRDGPVTRPTRADRTRPSHCWRSPAPGRSSEMHRNQQHTGQHDTGTTDRNAGGNPPRHSTILLSSSLFKKSARREVGRFSRALRGKNSTTHRVACVLASRARTK